MARLTRNTRAAERDFSAADALVTAGEDYRSQQLARAVSRAARDGQPYLERALNAYFNRGDFAQALKDIDVYLQLTEGPPDDIAVTIKVEALGALGQLGPAIEFLTGLIAAYPNIANLHAQRAALYDQRGEGTRARADRDIHADLLLRNKKDCIRSLDAMAAAQPNADAILIERGRLHEDVGDTRAALADARKAAALASENQNLRAWVEDLILQLGETQ